ncbi:hypothetical protein MLD38_027063 [Melastoma candidum]|uniref:Uncharacterized protein n=1 Tax=Melastoma candidum TaxID=119954 RepID=A0ACB9P1H0_9MYRT|nr:hypothetical protein MLD38_027063 [Melastoma candidum]
MDSGVPMRKVAVIGSGIAGAVCASSLARSGFSVTIFESARGPGGRMSQRRESADGKELLFDHGAPFFTVRETATLSGLLQEWERKGLIAEWKGKFGSFDCHTRQFLCRDQEVPDKKYVGVPGMNSICKALCDEAGVESRFGVGIAQMDWLEKDDSWSLIGIDGQGLGNFDGMVASDKNLVSSRVTAVTGRTPPLDLNFCSHLANKVKEIPVNPCFAVMLAFSEPLSSIPFVGLNFVNSKVLNWAHCENSKPGRSTSSERWVLHSSKEYAESIIDQFGLRKPSPELLARVAEDLLRELADAGLDLPKPFFVKAHRWGSAFPVAGMAPEEKCLWDSNRKLAICGDFCVSPNVEGAITSGMVAASKITSILSRM